MSPQMKDRRVNHQAIADQLRAVPGEWLTVQVYPSRYTATSTARLVRQPLAGRPAYHPAGAFETRLVMVDEGTALLARYVGGVR